MEPIPACRRARRGPLRLVGSSAVGLAIVGVLVLCGTAAAQRYPFVRFTAEDGLSGSQIWDIHQDSRGLIWVASTWGIQRYDGVSFVNLSTPEGLPTANARCTVEDSDGNLWFGTNDGVARFDGHAIEPMHDLPDAPRGIVWGGAVDAAGRIWFGTQFGLVRYAGGAFHRFGRADGLADDYVYGLEVARDGSLWVGSRGAGVAHCQVDDAGDPAGCRIFTKADGLGGNVVRAIAQDAAGRILVGSRKGGLSIFEKGVMHRLEIPGHPASDDVYALLVRHSGTVAIGYAPGGVLLCRSLEPAKCRLLDQANGLPEDQIFSLLEDREGELWIGTEGGLAQLVRDDVWSFGTAEGLPSPFVYALSSDGEGGVWAGTVGGLAHVRVGDHGEPTVRVWRKRDGLPSEFVWSVLRDRRGDVWAGTEAGLCRLNGGKIDCVRLDGGPGSRYILSLAEGADGSLWAGTTVGVEHLLFDERGRIRRVEVLPAPAGAGPTDAYAVAVDHSGRVWAASGKVLSEVEDGKLQPIGAADGLHWRFIRGLGRDRNGRLLVGGYGKLARYEPHPGRAPFRVWDHIAGLGGEVILTLAEDDQGRFVLGTNRGVVVVDPEARQGGGAVLVRFDAQSGAAASEVSHSSAFTRDSRGRWWFGFKGGLTCVAGALVPPPPAPPALFFSRLESGHGRVFMAPFSGVESGPVGWLGGAPAELPHDDDSVRAQVRALSFLRRGDLRYQFRLVGGEDRWSDARSEPFRYLTNLDPGPYRLEARAAHADGPWGPIAQLAFAIQPAWWQTGSFRYGAATLGALLIALAVGWRVRRAEIRARAARAQDRGAHR